jgi:predicted aminopeptidase
VGSVPYKGFFSEEDALAFKAEYPDYDTHIRTSSAFSSLGWFDDPVTPNLLELSDVELTETLFHELFHRTAWIPGSVSKNESAANFFGVMANIKFYESDPEKLKTAKANLNRSLALSEDLTILVNKLNKTFSDHTLSFEQKMLAKESLYKESGLPLTPNNAELLQLWIYFEYFKFYRDLFIKNNRSLPDFIKAFKDDTN